jgi:RecB family exonuclease
MKPTPKEAKVIHEHYERVVDHLMDEGYANTRENAEKIISGMSEEWYSLIVK